MTPSPPCDRTPQLRHLMQQVNLSSFKALSQASGVSEKQLRHLRQGNLKTLRLTTIVQVSRVLQLSVAELIGVIEGSAPAANSQQPGRQAANDPLTLDGLRQEYARLQGQLAQQRDALWQEFQQTSLQTLESLLLQLPTALYAAQQNPQAPAVKLIPLLKPIDGLLRQWGIEAIAIVGDEVPYEPQQHQLMEGTAQPGDRVRVRYTGYRQGEKLLYRAKVSRV